MTETQPDRKVAARFAVGERVLYRGAVMVVCGVCRCGPMWLYECRPEHEPDPAPRLHAERFLEATAGDVRPHAPPLAERTTRHRQFARRAEV
jgi:hypothetical protein